MKRVLLAVAIALAALPLIAQEPAPVVAAARRRSRR